MRYHVANSTAWAIKQGARVVVEVTSEGYAKFLCALLNSGTEESQVINRPVPDLEYLGRR